MPISIHIPASEGFDETTMTFCEVKKAQTLVLEHSLYSLAKWESKWKIPFLDTKEKTEEQKLDYIRFMCLTRNIDDEVFLRIPAAELKRINDYIEDPMTAAVFHDARNGGHGAVGRTKITTAETIYIGMINNNIPWECEKWHLNRLLALLRGCSIVNNPKNSKMPKADVYKSNKARNAARRARLGSKG